MMTNSKRKTKSNHKTYTIANMDGTTSVRSGILDPIAALAAGNMPSVGPWISKQPSEPAIL